MYISLSKLMSWLEFYFPTYTMKNLQSGKNRIYIRKLKN